MSKATSLPMKRYDDGMNEEEDDDFHIPPKPPLDMLKKWRKATLELNASRRFRYVLDLKKSEDMFWAVQCQKRKLLGIGTFGSVYLCSTSDSGFLCAVKEVLLVSDDSRSKESVEQLRKEISLLSWLKHPNIVEYLGTRTLEDRLCIYLEYVSGGSIDRLLERHGQFEEPVIRSYTRQILSGVEYLHKNKTVHRDIKGANILVDTHGIDGTVRLADFGMAKHITAESFACSFKGSPYWMAPEVIRNEKGYDLAVDIWSLGCTVLEMATAKPPWSQYEGVAAIFIIGNSKELPAVPDSLSPEGRDFVKQCLQRNPLERPTAQELLEHPFVRNVPSGW